VIPADPPARRDPATLVRHAQILREPPPLLGGIVVAVPAAGGRDALPVVGQPVLRLISDVGQPVHVAIQRRDCRAELVIDHQVRRAVAGHHSHGHCSLSDSQSEDWP